MKKLTMGILTGMLLFAVCASVQAAPTADNWSAKLTFSTSNTSDLLPITIGESTSSREVMKPPPMPGKAVTGNIEDAVVNAYIKTAGKKAAESTAQADSTLPGRVWPVEINVEQGSTGVFVSADLSNFYTGYKLSIINPETGSRTPITQSNQQISLFDSPADGGVKTVYVMAGSSNSFAVAADGVLNGAVDMFGVPDGKKDGLKVVIKETGASAITDENGFFTIQGLSPGTYTIRADRIVGPGEDVAGTLASQGTLTVSADNSAALAMSDVMTGDADNSGFVDIDDLVLLRLCVGKTVPDTNCPQIGKLDFDRSGFVDIDDFVLLKLSISRTEPLE